MRLTIIPEDNAVIIDNESKILDLSTVQIPSTVHALQWFDTKGWIEPKESEDPFIPKEPNQIIEVLPQWAEDCVILYNSYIPPAQPTVQP